MEERKLSCAEELEQLKNQLIEAFTDGKNENKIEEIEEARKELMRKLKLLEGHKQKISQTADGRYITYIYADGKRKKISRKTRREVEEELIKYYQPEETETIDALYHKWIDDMTLRGHNSTAVRYHYDWRKYLENSELAASNIKNLKASEITRQLIGICKEHGVSVKKFRDLKSILNGIYDYAVVNDIVETNRAREVRGVSPDLFVEAEKKPDAEQIFSEEEQEAFVRACLDLYEKRSNPAYLAVVLNFLLGLRAGELCALKVSDFDFDRHTLTVQRSEVKVKSITGDGRASSAGTRIVQHLKAGKKQRVIAIDTEATAALVKYIIEQVEATGNSCEEWLFTRPDGERVTEANIMHAMQNANARAGIKQRGNHSIRKTVITRLIQSRLFSTTDVMRQAGHSTYETTQKYYAFAEKRDRSEAISQALNFRISSDQFGSVFGQKETPEKPLN